MTGRVDRGVARPCSRGLRPDGAMNDDRQTSWLPAWAVLTALAALAIVFGAARWVLDTRFPDTDLPTAQLEVLPGDRQATLQWRPDKPATADVEWQYEQRYGWRENE